MTGQSSLARLRAQREKHTDMALAHKLQWAMLVLFALLFCVTAQAEVAVPQLVQHVTDLTGSLTVGEQQALESKLSAFEQSKGAQIAVLMLPTTQPETIDQYSIRVVDAWKLGRKKVDDGVLLLIAKEDRKLRIEVGYGLEGALNDATAKRIVSEVISPLFKQGRFYAGVDAGVDNIIKVIEGEALPPPTSSHQSPSAYSDKLNNLLVAGAIVFMVGNFILRHLLGRLFSGLIVAGLIGGIAWLILNSIAAGVIIGFMAFVLSMLFGQSGGGGSSFPTGWGGGSYRGGDSGGGWSGGGGGGFGGGGASGDW